MDIRTAKQQVKDAIETYLATDEAGEPLIPPSSQRPVFLVGAPGIGKTAIMAQIADELDIGLVSYSMTHHTRQSALGLPFIISREYGGQTYDASEYTMSEIIGSVYDCMRESGRERGILFLDEINCVSETLYPSMLQFLQFKTFGRHKVPDGWIVVTAGNPPEYNRSVHEFDVVTLDRVKRIPVEPDFDAWKAYALDKGVHPAILTFLEAKRDRFYSIETTLDGKAFVTARAWDDLSDIIRAYETLGKTVDEAFISHYIQNPKFASEFAAYYDLFNKYRDDYRINAVLEGEMPPEALERAKVAPFDERLSLLGLLLDALEGEHRQIMAQADVFVAVRDDLRQALSLAAGDAEADQPPMEVADALKRVMEAREAEREALASSGGNVRGRVRILKEALAKLEAYGRVLDEEAVPPEAQEARLRELFAGDDELDRAAAAAQERLSHAFAFLMEAFGDEQEMLVFVTELTQRTPSARFIAQFGSDSYYEHNQKMILSDAQRRLRARVEELEL